MTTARTAATLALALAAALPAAAEPAAGGFVKDDPFTAPRTAWYREAKYGMFIHWGLYAVPAGEYNGKKIGGIGEWIMANAKIPIPEYEKFAARFNPVQFDATAWARAAKAAGMRYLVITSKHHDGFSMFDTKVNDYSIVKATPFKRDPMKELAAACRAEGIRFCFYYSIMDWHHPEANDRGAASYIPQMKEQLRELVTQYDPELLWFDGEWVGWWNAEKGRDLEAFLRGLKPSLVINNRVGKRKATDGDYETPEQEIPKGAMGKRLWETCMTLNDTWGFKTDDHNWKKAPEVVHKLCDIASKGGNFLLNVGPDAEGVIPEPSVKILAEAGRWVAENGEAIYGTTYSPVPNPSWGRITRKGNKLYLIVFNWPSNGTLSLALGNPVKKASLLRGGGEVKVQKTADGSGVELAVPAAAPSQPASVIVLECEGEFQAVKSLAERTADGEPMPVQPDGSILLPAIGARLVGDTLQIEGQGEENIGFWTKPNESVEWYVQPKKAGTYKVEVTFACADGYGSDYEVAVGAGKVTGTSAPTGGWQAYKTVALGTVTLGEGKAKVVVKPTTNFKQALMNLRSVKLTPAP